MEAAMGVKYRPVVFSNGGAAAKKMRPPAAGESVYRECLKNHAASLGGHAVDGCGEFMPSPAANPSNPTSLKCAACGCHRNFHRRLPEAPPSPPLLALPPVPMHAVACTSPAPAHLTQAVHPQQRGEEAPQNRPPVPGDDYSEDSDEGSDYDDDDDRPSSPIPAAADVPPPGYLSGTHMLLSLSTGAPGSSTALMAPRSPAPAPGLPDASASASAARKRIRTKFSPEQKQQMQALSERLGWRLQKSDQAVVQESCREIGVGKGVFKVWMHNNKHNFLGGHSARRSASLAAGTPHPSTHAAPPPAPAMASTPPPIHAGFNINGSSTSAAPDHSGVQPVTASAGSGSPQSYSY